MSITQTPAGWMFTRGAETYGPYATREEACERGYDAERGLSDTEIRGAFHTLRTIHAQNVADSLARLQQPGDLVDAALAFVAQDEELAIAEWIDENDKRITIAREIDRILAESVTYQRKHLSDGSGGPGWDEYSAGGCILAVEDGAILLWSPDMELGEWDPADLRSLRALLNDARIVALMEAQPC